MFGERVPDKLLLNENGVKLERIGGRYKLSKKNGNTWNFMWLDDGEFNLILGALYNDPESIKVLSNHRMLEMEEDVFYELMQELGGLDDLVDDWEVLIDG